MSPGWGTRSITTKRLHNPRHAWYHGVIGQQRQNGCKIMGLVRMFHYSCDANMNYDCDHELGDEWYASAALAIAKNQGWHTSGDRKTAICGTCWENGARF